MADPRAPGKYLVPFNFEKDGTTGHFTWYCRIEEVGADGNVMQGPPVQWGLTLDVLTKDYGGLHENFLAQTVKPAMLTQYDALAAAHEDAQPLIGSSL